MTDVNGSATSSPVGQYQCSTCSVTTTSPSPTIVLARPRRAGPERQEPAVEPAFERAHQPALAGVLAPEHDDVGATDDVVLRATGRQLAHDVRLRGATRLDPVHQLQVVEPLVDV